VSNALDVLSCQALTWGFCRAAFLLKTGSANPLSGALPVLPEAKGKYELSLAGHSSDPTLDYVGGEKVKFEAQLNGYWQSFFVHQRNLKLLLYREDQLTAPEEAQKLKMRHIFERLLFGRQLLALTAWVKFSAQQGNVMDQNRREAAATHIQALLRSYGDRCNVARKRQEMLRIAKKHLLAQSKNKNKLKRREVHKVDENAGGVTMDGVNFFKNICDLKEWNHQRAALAERCRRRLYGILIDHLRFGFQSWIDRTKEIKEYAAETQHMPEPPADMWKRQLADDALLTKWEGHWHPGLHIKLPKLPELGVKLHADGAVHISSYGIYRNLKSSMGGPTDVSNWLVKDRVLTGAYPMGQARLKNNRPSSTSAAVTQILLNGIGLFVSVMEPYEMEEYDKMGLKPWRIEIAEQWKKVHTEFQQAVVTATDPLRNAERAVRQSKNYGYVCRLWFVPW
jgi:hypothetical protein